MNARLDCETFARHSSHRENQSKLIMFMCAVSYFLFFGWEHKENHGTERKSHIVNGVLDLGVVCLRVC